MLKVLRLCFLARKVLPIENLFTPSTNLDVEEPLSLEIFQDFTRHFISLLPDLKAPCDFLLFWKRFWAVALRRHGLTPFR